MNIQYIKCYCMTVKTHQKMCFCYDTVVENELISIIFGNTLPAHFIEEAIRLCHAIQLMFVLLQQVHITLLWDKLQHLED